MVFPVLDLVYTHKEVLSTRRAGEPCCSLPRESTGAASVLHDQEWFATFDPTMPNRPSRVTRLAAWNEVVGTVVEHVTVDVICNNPTGSLSERPDEWSLAPVTRVLSRTNLVVQDGAMLKNASALHGDGMAWPVKFFVIHAHQNTTDGHKMKHCLPVGRGG